MEEGNEASKKPANERLVKGRGDERRAPAAASRRRQRPLLTPCVRESENEGQRSGGSEEHRETTLRGQ